MRVTLVLAALGILAGAGASAQEASEPIRPAKVFTVLEAERFLRRSFPALVSPSKEVVLSFRVGGRLIELPLRGALDVEAGDVLAQLDPRDFERQIAQLESQKDQAEAQLKALRAGARSEEIAALEAAVASAQAQVDQAREQLNRTRNLASDGIVSSARLEQDEANLRVVEANLQAQQEQLAIGKAGGRPEEIDGAVAAVRGIEAQLQVAKDNLNDATLTAPFSGIVARRDVDNFTLIQPGQSVALLQALDKVHLTFDVPGPDVTAFTTSGLDNVLTSVSFDALPGEWFNAELVEFSVQADAATQTYRGRVAVTVPEEAVILPGMVGKVVVTAPAELASLMIPLSAVAVGPDGATFVWLVATDGSVARQDIALADAVGDMVAVTEGLKAGDTLVAVGVSRILEGMRIRPVDRIGG